MPRASQSAQPGLFDEGQRLKNEGIARVLASNADWHKKAFVAFVAYTKRHKRQIVTGEHIRFIVLDALNHQRPGHPNAYGALVRNLGKDGYLRRTGKWAPMKDPSSHSRLTPTYRISA